MCGGLGPAAGLLRPAENRSIPAGEEGSRARDARRRCGSGAAAHPGPTSRQQAVGAAAHAPARACWLQAAAPPDYAGRSVVGGERGRGGGEWAQP